MQTLSLTDGSFGTGNFVINPTGTLAYGVEERLVSEEMPAKIIEFTIDPTTGIVTRAPKPVAAYKPNGPHTPAAEANLGYLRIQSHRSWPSLPSHPSICETDH